MPACFARMSTLKVEGKMESEVSSGHSLAMRRLLSCTAYYRAVVDLQLSQVQTEAPNLVRERIT